MTQPQPADPGAAAYRTFDVRPLTPHIGAEVSGINLASIDGAQLAEVKRAFLDWAVLVFRDQHLTQEQHKALGRAWGPLHVHPMKHGGDGGYGGDPEILTVKTTANSRYTAGDGWHTDVSCDEKPPMGSMLYVTETPASGGGDTLFANMYRAFETLSAPMQQFLEGLTAIHDGAIPYVTGYGVLPPDGQSYPKNEHPVVIRHPETGRKVLFVNSGFTARIKDLRAEESHALLQMLYRHIAETPSLHCRVQWQPNTLTFWDNRCTQHHAVWDYFPETRCGERVSIVGERPTA